MFALIPIRAIKFQLCVKFPLAYDETTSKMVSLNRTVPDTREEECKWWDYPTDLPKASVVLVFHNEGNIICFDFFKNEFSLICLI